MAKTLYDTGTDALGFLHFNIMYSLRMEGESGYIPVFLSGSLFPGSVHIPGNVVYAVGAERNQRIDFTMERSPGSYDFRTGITGIKEVPIEIGQAIITHCNSVRAAVLATCRQQHCTLADYRRTLARALARPQKISIPKNGHHAEFFSGIGGSAVVEITEVKF